MASDKFTGTWNGEEVSCFRSFAGHELTDKECELLLAGHHVMFPARSKAGKDYMAICHIVKEGEYANVKMDFEYEGTDVVADGPIPVQEVFFGHKFTDDELDALREGRTIECLFTWKSGKQSTAKCKLDKGWKLELIFDD